MVRKQQLAETRAKEETFEWVWTSEFKTWLESSSPLFWISGKPASGKSTLMEHLSSDGKALEFLHSSINKEWTVIYHFFDFRAGNQVRNNLDGFLRSLILQLCLSLPECKEQVALHFKNSAWNDQIKHWPSAELHSALDVALRAASSPIFLLVDGLDEFEGDGFQLCRVIRRIASPRLKVCVASRPDPPYPDAFRDVSSIRMDRLNESGISSFTNDIMMEFWRPTDTIHRQKILDLSQEITARAQGVFLWARFAVTEVLHGQTRGEELEELQERLDGVPSELKDIYTRIFRRMTAEEKEFTSRVLVLVIHGMRTLTIQEVFVAMSINLVSQSLSLPKRPNYADFCKKMLVSTGGILEIFGRKRKQEPVEMFSSQRVHLIHRTVEYHLQKYGWVDLDVDGTDLIRPHYYMIRICGKILQGKHLELEKALTTHMSTYDPTSWISFSENDRSAQWWDHVSFSQKLYNGIIRSQNSEDTACPLLVYALQYLPQHAIAFEKNTGTSSYRLLHNVLNNAYVYVHVRLGIDGSCCFCRDNESYRDVVIPKSYVDPPLYLAITHGLTLFVEESLVPENSGVWKHLSSKNPMDLQCKPSLNTIHPFSAPNEVSDVVGLVAVAISAASKSLRNDILELCLAFDSFVEDRVFRWALIRAPSGVVQTLLNQSRTASGDFTFRSSIDYADFPGDDEELGEVLNFRPLWDVAKRTKFTGIEDIIDMFLERGEDINGHCGPAGTAVFSVLRCQFLSSNLRQRWGNYSYPHYLSFLDILVRKGADINANGPHGTPLEYFWKMVNTHEVLRDETIKRFRKTISRLIELGGVNRKQDPDGQIPSVEEMLSWKADKDARKASGRPKGPLEILESKMA